MTWFKREHEAVQPLRETPEDHWIGTYNRAGTCVPAICAVVKFLCERKHEPPHTLDAIEIGGGFNSTPVLHSLCFSVTLESDEKWYEMCRGLVSKPGYVFHDPDGEYVKAYADDSYGGTCKIDLVLVDHWTDGMPRERVVKMFKRGATVILIHDADDAWMEANRELVESFKSWRRYERLSPETLIVSDYEDLSGLEL